VRPLLADVADRFAPRAGAAGRALEVDAAVDLELVGDRLRLQQALGSLVDNALVHGGGTVRLEAERRNGALELRVHDDGDGFPRAFRPRAFERFSRADESRRNAGAGLGLALVDAVATAHGGTASVAEEGDGATVVVRLPAAPGPAPAGLPRQPRTPA